MHAITALLLAASLVAASSSSSRYGDLITSKSGVQASCQDARGDLINVAHSPRGLDLAMKNAEGAQGRLRATREASRFELAMADAYAPRSADISRLEAGKFTSFSGDRDVSSREAGTKLDISAFKANTAHAGAGKASTNAGSVRTFTGDRTVASQLRGSETTANAQHHRLVDVAGSGRMEGAATAIRSDITRVHSVAGDKDAALRESGASVRAMFAAHRSDKMKYGSEEAKEAKEACEEESGEAKKSEEAGNPEMIERKATSPEFERKAVVPEEQLRAILSPEMLVKSAQQPQELTRSIFVPMEKSAILQRRQMLFQPGFVGGRSTFVRGPYGGVYGRRTWFGRRRFVPL